MPQLFDNQQEFTEAAIGIFVQTKLSDKYDIVIEWPDKNDWRFAIGLEPPKFGNQPRTLPNYDYHPDIVFFQTEDGFMYCYTRCSLPTWDEPEFCDYEESDKTFDSLEEAINDYAKLDEYEPPED